MSLHSVIAALGVFVLTATCCPAAEFAVLFTMGLKDSDAVSWSGSASATGGEITTLDGWRFERDGKVTGEWTWECRSRDPGGPKDDKRRKIQPVGVVVGGKGDSGTEITLTVPAGTVSVSLGQLPIGKQVRVLEGAVSAERVPRPNVLSDSEREDDYPSLCVAPNDVLWCVWQSYTDGAEQLYVASSGVDGWAVPELVPGIRGDIYKSACAWVDGRLWIVWAQFTDDDWDLHAVSLAGKRWSEPIALTSGKGADVEPALAANGSTAVLVWQSTRGTHSDIRCRTLTGKVWGDAQFVTEAEGNDWFPQVTLATDGTASIVWDSYRNGDYDVYLRQLNDGAFGPEIPIGASDVFEAYASVAADREGRVWIAYEEGTAGWGKDQGAVVPRPAPGSRLYAKRTTRVRVFQGGQLFTPEAQPVTITPAGQPRQFHEKPRLTVDGKGRVFLALRWAMATTRYLRGRGHYRHYKAWESYITSYDGKAWASPVYLPESISRLDSYATPCGLAAGGVALAWHTDSRTMADVRLPVKNRVLAARLPSPGDTGSVALKSIALPSPKPPAAHPKEVADTHRIRAHRALIDGKEQRILRGDTHRHTEVSWDGSGDGSMVDVWRYGIDPGALDFLEITDHNQRTGPDLEYVWWRTQKITDVYHNPPHFIAMFGYERSLNFPNGHRNIVNAKRGYRTFPITKNPGGKGVADDDTKQLYANERDRGSVIISHTSGTNMGNDWRDSDPVLEPVVEIYQGARTSYEYEGAPRSANPGDRQAKNSGYQPEGFVWRAWEKGLRLGIIASSDHGSTHISYASVYVEEPTREGVIFGLRKRHTFGATDNIIVELRCGDHFMGDEFASSTAPRLQIRTIGTGEISELAIIKDLAFVYTGDPQGTEAVFEWADADFGPGTHLYYVRVQQEDGQIAWSSPIWVTNR